MTKVLKKRLPRRVSSHRCHAANTTAPLYEYVHLPIYPFFNFKRKTRLQRPFKIYSQLPNKIKIKVRTKSDHNLLSITWPKNTKFKTPTRKIGLAGIHIDQSAKAYQSDFANTLAARALFSDI